MNASQPNRANWNERTPVHAASEFYDVEGFKKGWITLTDIERREVGDVSGKTLLHLQCHFGMDTMSWSPPRREGHRRRLLRHCPRPRPLIER